MQHLYKFMLTDNSNILMAQQILAVKKEKHKHSKCFVSSCPLEITCSVALCFLKTLLVVTNASPTEKAYTCISFINNFQIIYVFDLNIKDQFFCISYTEKIWILK